jgi:hypothetical protein
MALDELNDLIDTALAVHHDGARLNNADAARLSVLLGVPACATRRGNPSPRRT